MNRIRPLLIAALLSFYSLAAYAAPTQQAALKKYAKHPVVANALQLRKAMLDAYNDAISAIQVTAGIKLGQLDRQIDALLVRVHKAEQAKAAKARRARKPKARKRVPKKGKARK